MFENKQINFLLRHCLPSLRGVEGPHVKIVQRKEQWDIHEKAIITKRS